MSFSLKPTVRARPVTSLRASATALFSLTCKCTWSVIASYSFPSSDRHACPFAYARKDFKFIREPFGATQAQPQPIARRVTVFQRQFDIRNTRPMVFKSEPQPPARLAINSLEPDSSASAMVERVARQFAGRRDDLGLVYQAKTLRRRPLTGDLPNAYDVFG